MLYIHRCLKTLRGQMPVFSKNSSPKSTPAPWHKFFQLSKHARGRMFFKPCLQQAPQFLCMDSLETQLALFGAESIAIFLSYTTEHSDKFFLLMNLSPCLIWVRRGSGSEGSRNSGQILVNPVTMCLEAPLQNVEKLMSYCYFCILSRNSETTGKVSFSYNFIQVPFNHMSFNHPKNFKNAALIYILLISLQKEHQTIKYKIVFLLANTILCP